MAGGFCHRKGCHFYRVYFHSGNGEQYEDNLFGGRMLLGATEAYRSV